MRTAPICTVMVSTIWLVLATLFARASLGMEAEERALRSMERHMNIPPVSNTRLMLHRIASFRISHHFQCSQLCYLTPDCHSYNYCKGDGICELNDVNRTEFKRYAKNEKGWDYYERRSALISRALWYECYHVNPCQNGAVCVRKLLMGREAERPACSPVCVCTEGFSGLYCERGLSTTPSKVACGSIQYESSGTIWSPNYPTGYDSRMWCETNLTVTVAEGNVLEFTFDPTFELEYHPDCLFDYVQLSEPGQPNSLGRYCGDGFPQGPIRSSGHVVVVEFRSDDSIVGTGFSVHWRTVLMDACESKTTDTRFEYRWDLSPLTGSLFTFEVQANNDVKLALSPLNQTVQVMYHLTIGGWHNSQSAIQRGNEFWLFSTPGILSPLQNTNFWFSWDPDGTIAVGRGGETDPFMRWVDPRPLSIAHVGYSTGWGSSGLWTFCPTVRHGACETKETNDEPRYRWDLPPLTRSPFTFDVQARREAKLALSSHNQQVDEMYVIVLGGWDNTGSVIRRDKSGNLRTYAHTPDITSSTEFRRFWISWDSNGTVAVGRDGETAPFMVLVDPEPLPVNHVGYYTKQNSPGLWHFCPVVGVPLRDCSDVLKAGFDSSGIYTIYPYSNDVQESGRSFGVFCDMVTDGGGWTVFQRRQDGSWDFYRDWADYKAGFGKLDGEFWLGNDKIHQLSSQAQYELRVDMEDFEGNSAYAQYRFFHLGSEAELFRLTVSSYNGTAGDSLAYHNGRSFSTKDSDNDVCPNACTCATGHKGGWWYRSCHEANLNGEYKNGPLPNQVFGVSWYRWKGHWYSLKHTEMKIRPIAN